MKQIMVTTDFSEESFKAFPYARLEATNAGKESSRIHLVSALEAPGAALPPVEISFPDGSEQSFVDELRSKAANKLHQLCQEHFVDLPHTTAVINGVSTISRDLLAYATKHKIDLIVVATHGRTGLAHTAFGSIVEHLVRHASMPVLVIPTKDRSAKNAPKSIGEHWHILATSDLSPSSEVIFPYLAEHVARLGKRDVRVTLLTVVPDLSRATFHITLGSNMNEIFEDMENQGRQGLLAIRDRCCPGLIATDVAIREENGTYGDIVNYAKDRHADLIILATHGRTSFNHFFLGSIAERVIRHSPIPVLVVPTRGLNTKIDKK